MAETLSMKVNNQICTSERSSSLPCKEDTNRETRSEVGKQATIDLIFERNDGGLN